VTGEINNKARPRLRNGPHSHGRRKRRRRRRKKKRKRREEEIRRQVS
jgi:hypothetical protein